MVLKPRVAFICWCVLSIRLSHPNSTIHQRQPLMRCVYSPSGVTQVQSLRLRQGMYFCDVLFCVLLLFLCLFLFAVFLLCSVLFGVVVCLLVFVVGGLDRSLAEKRTVRRKTLLIY